MYRQAVDMGAAVLTEIVQQRFLLVLTSCETIQSLIPFLNQIFLTVRYSLYPSNRGQRFSTNKVQVVYQLLYNFHWNFQFFISQSEAKC